MNAATASRYLERREAAAAGKERTNRARQRELWHQHFISQTFVYRV